MTLSESQGGPVIKVALDNEQITVLVNDDELRDYVADHLTENFDGIEVEGFIGQTLLLVASANLDRVKSALALLPQEEIERIWLLNNPRS